MGTDRKMSKHLRTRGPSLDKERIAQAKAEMAKLHGKHKHFCAEWDYMAIDETMPEFAACTCADANNLRPHR